MSDPFEGATWLKNFPHAEQGWRDIPGQLFIPTADIGSPVWGSVGDSEFYAYKFGLDTHCWFMYHLNHDYRAGTPLYVHVHWMPDGSDPNPVRWVIQYVFAKGHNQGNFEFGDGSGSSITVEQSPPGTPYRHMITEHADGIIDPRFEPDGILWTKVSRQTNEATDNENNIFVLTCDLHYQAGETRATRNRLPPFNEGV